MKNNLSKNLRSFQKRWDVHWDDKIALDQFKNRLLFLLDKHLSRYIVSNKNFLNQFIYYCGLSNPFSSSGDLDRMLLTVQLEQHGIKETILFSAISNSQSPKEFAWYLHNLFSALAETLPSNLSSSFDGSLNAFVNDLKDLLSATPSIQIQLSKTKKGIVVYPAGAKLLDDSLVNDNLIWLQDYPESLNAFEQALSIYLGGDKPKFRNLIDNLRVAIEQLLRKVLDKPKNLENLSKELGDWLEKHGTHKQVRNLYGQLLHIFTTLQNDVAKHGDVELLPDEIEYLIYLTGTFMRLIIQLRRSEA